MPDPAKLKVLTDAKYEIRETCFSCTYFEATTPFRMWGSCRRIPSAHTKHTDGARLSVRVDGWCPGYEASGGTAVDLRRSGFDCFIKEDKER